MSTNKEHSRKKLIDEFYDLDERTSYIPIEEFLLMWDVNPPYMTPKEFVKSTKDHPLEWSQYLADTRPFKRMLN